MITDKDSEGKTWRCMGFYGAPEEFRRDESWRLLRTLDNSPNIPWLVIRDFNEIIYSTEKQGGLPR